MMVELDDMLWRVLTDYPEHNTYREIDEVAAILLIALRPFLATAWDEGHGDGCDDHMCVEMGHLEANPYRTTGERMEP